MKKLTPLGNKLIVKRDESEDKSAGGIILPDVAKTKPQRGRVIAVGPGKRNDDTGDVIPLDIAPGDVVLFTQWGGNEVTIEGETYLILRDDDVLAVID